MPHPEPAPGSGAVFLSYANEDTDVALAVCESLREAGVEVWMDHSELQGGDAWDAKIRRQIRECALFIPIISAKTQARAEGYFRLEWRLADERVQLRAHGTALILPVAADATKQSEALVPPSFLAVQWVRLPGGNIPAALALRVRRLMGLDSDSATPLPETGVEPAAIRTFAGQRAWSPRSTIRWAVVILSVGILLGVAADWFLRPPPAPVPRNPLSVGSFTTLTDFTGDEFAGAISQDGRFVSFLSDHDGESDIWVGDVDSREFRNVTDDLADLKRGDARAPIRNVGFTGDPSALWFRVGTSSDRLETMSVLGGRPQPFLGDGVAEVAWSPDGSRIVYHRDSAGDPVFVADAAGANKVLILSSEAGRHQHFPTWSPDGHWIYLVRGVPITGEMELWRVRPDGSELKQLTEGLLDVAYPAPIDEHTVLFCAREPNGAGPWIWTIDPQTGIPARATLGVEQYSSVSASADGRRLVATVENQRASLSRVPILEDREATESDVEPVELNTVSAWAPRYGGEDDKNRLFYLSSRGGGDRLWSRQDGESVQVSRNIATALLVPPAVSPDGDSVALVLREESGQHVYVLSGDGAELNPLTARVDVRRAVSWSPDEQWVVASGSQDGVDGLFKIPVDGGPPVRILEGPALSPVWSPKGNLIVYAGPQVQALAPMLGITPDGQPVELPDIKVLRGGERFRFLPNGSGLVYMQGQSPSQDFWLLNLTTKQPHRLTRLEDRGIMRTFGITQDGSYIVFDRLQLGSNLVSIELPAAQADTIGRAR